ncbi:MAG: guanine deaminase [Eubacteriales bacterium]
MIIKGDIVFAKNREKLTMLPDGVLVIENGLVVFAGEAIPEAYKNEPVTDYSGHLVMPGFCDMHSHAPQFENIGLGMNMTLLPWLEKLTFPTEYKYHDLAYAKEKYKKVIAELIRQGTTRAVIYATVHVGSAQILVDMMEEAGLCGLAGKVNMDRNCPDYLVEETKSSLAETKMFLEKNKNNSRVLPVITPRFAPTCTKELLAGLGELAAEYDVPIQSHINENLDEIKWVADLFPEAENYADVYVKNGLLNDKTLMAHCIHMKPEETVLFAEKGVMAVHCPHSNANISSGMMPLKIMMEAGVRVGLGSDVSGGHAVSMLKVMVLALQMSKLRYQQNQQEGFLKLADVFFLATKGGGSFFGKVGSFEPGYAFDALVVDDSALSTDKSMDLEARLGRFVYTGDDRQIIKRYIDGRAVDVPTW